MAQSVRERRQVGRRRTAAVLLAAGASLVGEVGSQESRPQSQSQSSAQSASQPHGAAARVERVLARCHGVLRGTFDRVLLELRERADGPETSVLLVLPERMRVRAAGGEPAFLSTAASAERTRLHELRDLLALLLLQPLVAAERIEDGEGGALRVLAGGSTYLLTLDEQDRPAALRGPGGEVRFLEHLDTGVTVLPKKVVLGPLGERWVRILGTGVIALDEAFAPRVATDPDEVVRVASDADDGRGPRTPTLLDLEARQWLVLDDPASWPERARAVDAASRMLHERGQRSHGLPAYYAAGARPRLAVPFRPRAERAFTSQGETVLAMRAHRAAVVVTPALPFATALERGSRQLADLLVRERRTATGPLRVIPFLDPSRAPTPQDLAAVELRLELPVEPWQ